MDGILLIDKPPGITSHDVVGQARKRLGMRRIGHTGTLDPMATGLLILCLGRATRLASFIAREDKVYRGRITLGVATDTYDADGKVVSSSSIKSLSKASIQKIARTLTGRIKQTPPPYSAKKVSGERSYNLARKGQAPELKPVDVSVHSFKVTSLKKNCIYFEASVSAGTYIRSLAHDLGRILGCGAHLSELKRIVCGGFHLSDAHDLSIFKKSTNADLRRIVIPLSKISLRLPSIFLDEDGATIFKRGNPVPESRCIRTIGTLDGKEVQVHSKEGRFLGIGLSSSISDKTSRLAVVQPKVVLSSHA
ncbi:MAG: tRNA pseudouridine(55) synthase TruB [Acidobacteriota bacterium]